MSNEMKNKKVNDGELNEVVGGVINWGDGKGNGRQDYIESVKFAFKVGDRVETWRLFGTQRGTVVKCKIFQYEMDDPASRSSYYYMPRYLVQLDKDETRDWYDQEHLSY